MSDVTLLQEISELKFGEVSLREDQYSHFLRLLKIAEINRYYIDMSPTGRGKSFVSLFLATVMNYKILIFTENAIASTWVNFAQRMGILDPDQKENELFRVITYSCVPGRKGSKSPKCCDGLLLREDLLVERKKPIYKKGVVEKFKEKTFYHLTDEAKEYFSDNTLAIFDEYHNIIGGHSFTSHALQTISKYLMEEKDHRIGFLSATPSVKQDNFVVFFKIIGVMTHKKLSTGRYTNKLKGMGQIIAYCSGINPDTTDLVARNYSVYSNSVNHITCCEALWNRVVKPNFASRMEDFEYRINGRRGHFTMAPEERENYEKGVRSLATAVNWTGQSFDKGTWDTRAQIRGLKKIEISKVGIFYRQVRKSIDQPLRKAVVWVQFIETVEVLESLLSDFNPKVIRGDVEMDDRDQIINSFLQPNDDSRILIISARCLSTGVSIHFTELNQEGKPYTVDVYISPSFFYIETCQFIGRFYRVGSVSIPNIWMVYPEKVGFTEGSIIAANEKKSKILQKTTSGAGSEVKTFLTSDFPEFKESEN